MIPHKIILGLQASRRAVWFDISYTAADRSVDGCMLLTATVYYSWHVCTVSFHAAGQTLHYDWSIETGNDVTGAPQCRHAALFSTNFICRLIADFVDLYTKLRIMDMIRQKWELMKISAVTFKDGMVKLRWFRRANCTKEKRWQPYVVNSTVDFGLKPHVNMNTGCKLLRNDLESKEEHLKYSERAYWQLEI